jgi:hypothetical protein
MAQLDQHAALRSSIHSKPGAPSLDISYVQSLIRQFRCIASTPTKYSVQILGFLADWEKKNSE